MNIRTRNNIFYALCAVFVTAGAFVVFYAQGWRFDLEPFGFNKVGGIYLRSFPDDAAIFINGKYVDKKPGLLNRGRFINNLFPKNYKLTLKSGGYYDWTENIQVSPSLVSELKYVVLIPKNYETAYEGLVKNFYAANGQLIINTGNSLVYGGKKIKGGKLIWQDSASKIVLTENISSKTYFINYLSENTATSTNLNEKIALYGINPANIREIIKDHGTSGGSIIRTAASIFSLNISTGEISKLTSSSSTISKIAVSPSWIAWINYNSVNGKSLLTFYNRASGEMTVKTAIAGQAVKIDFRNNDELGILQNDGNFYIASSENNQPGKTAEGVRDFEFSPKGNLVSLLENETLEIFAFNGDKDYWRFRLPEAQKIERVEWHADENHLFVIYPEETKFLGLEDKSIENFAVVADGKQAHYDADSNTFYFIKDGELRKLQFAK